MSAQTSSSEHPPAPAVAGKTPAGRSRELVGTLAVLVVIAALVLWGLPSYGIWDPWELSTADDARHLLAGEPTDATRAPLGAWLVARGFAVFGVHEWSGRLPIAIAGFLVAALAVGLGRVYGDLRRGSFVAIVVATSPLFLLNARHMMGSAPGFLASGLVFASAAGLAFPSRRLTDTRWVVGLAITLGVSLFLAQAASGVLLGAAPPLVGVAAAVIARLPWNERPFAPPADLDARRRFFVQLAVVAVAVVVGVGTALSIAANQEGYSAWTGGVPRGQTPPTFELPIEALFHSFAPWSALLPLAVGFVMTSGNRSGGVSTEAHADVADTSEHDALRGLDLAALAWVGLGLAAQSVHAARYGDGAFLPVLGIAWLVASFLRSLEQTSRGESWARGLVALLLVALLVRDFRGYPGTPVAGLSLRSFSMPEVFNPSGGWAATLGLFGLAAFFALASDVTAPARSFQASVGASSPLGALGRAMIPVDLLRAQWARGLGFRVWLTLLSELTSVLLGFGLVAMVLAFAQRGSEDEQTVEIAARVLPTILTVAGAVAVVTVVASLVLTLRIRSGGALDPARFARFRFWAGGLLLLASGVVIGAAIFLGVGANSLAIRVGQALFVVPLLIPVVIGVGRAVYFVSTSLRGNAFAPVFAAALLLAAWVVIRFHPQASAHFSPREVYDTYNALAAADEPLGEYQVGGRAAAYYARGEVEELRGEAEALAFLARPTRVWLALPAEQLAQLDRSYRQRAERHLFVADARNARVLLATNQPIAGRADENYLAGFVLDAPPAMQHTVNASFDRRIELLGYDLELPSGDSVGPGQSFAVTWYWRCVTPVPGGYQPFLHIDGFGQRLNGDHEPVAGRYPIRMWSEGDVVVDRHELRVPANFPPGDYTFYIGLYAGESRLEVVEGPEDDANRAAAGRLRVR